MRVPTNLLRGSLSFNMTPMIDVVFLLIIFFLVSSHLAQQDIQLELDLPDAASGEQPEEDDARRMVVNILPEPRAGRRIMVHGRLMRAEELAQLIRTENDRSTQPLEVRIRSDRTVPYRVVEPVMIACAKAEVWKVTFTVIGKPAGDAGS